MNMWKYLKDSHRAVLGFIYMLLLVNLFLLASPFLQQPLADILYLDTLLLLLALFLGLWGYRRWAGKYRALYQALEEQATPDFSLPGNDSLEARLLRDLLAYKNMESAARLAELQGSLAELNDFITRWVHEIKTPLSVCELIVDRLDESEEGEPIAGRSGELRTQLERMNFLVNQILYAGRAYSYAQDLLVEECSLNAIVKEAIKRNSLLFISRDIELELAPTDFPVRTDRKWLAYILDQLLNNACKYVERGGRIEISAREDEKAVYLVLRDNGSGIAPGDINRVFDRGFTGNNGRKIVKSTGMGLYFSQKMADKLGHRIEVVSKLGEFTEFTVTMYKLADYFKVTKM